MGVQVLWRNDAGRLSLLLLKVRYHMYPASPALTRRETRRAAIRADRRLRRLNPLKHPPTPLSAWSSPLVFFLLALASPSFFSSLSNGAHNPSRRVAIHIRIISVWCRAPQLNPFTNNRPKTAGEGPRSRFWFRRHCDLHRPLTRPPFEHFHRAPNCLSPFNFPPFRQQSSTTHGVLPVIPER